MYKNAKTGEIGNIKIEKGLFGRISNLMKQNVIPHLWEILNDRTKDTVPDHSIENFSIANGEEQEFPSHCIANFKIAAGLQEGDFYGMVFQDSDLAKWLEAAAYQLMAQPDQELEKKADDAIRLIGMAQQEDGYLNTYFTIKEPDKRFTNLCECHEFYCTGHMIEAAVAYYRATGKRELLDIMCDMVDCIDRTFGPEKGKLKGYPGHEEIELALVKLYRVTDDEKHLRLAKYFIDQRGQKPLYFDWEFEKRNHEAHFSYLYPPYGMYSNGSKYAQYHKPVREQEAFVGHAVRCMYLASGAVDVAKLTNDNALFDTCKKLYENMEGRRMYITGGVGSTPNGEMFTYDYDLPNDLVYGETCASIGLMFFMQRMLLVEQDSRYADTMERALFNTCIAGMSLDGKNFFYVNPLEVDPEASRENPNRKHVLPVRPAWFGCACCPPNLARMITSLAEYLYVVNGENVFVNLYMENQAKLDLDGMKAVFDVTTDYPYDGEITISIKQEAEFTFHLRIPKWCGNEYRIFINEAQVITDSVNGYAVLERDWKASDKITLALDMEPKRMYANPKVSKDVGKVAIQRGPVVYCLEEVDNGAGLQQVYLPVDSKLKVVDRPDKLEGIKEIYTEGFKLVNKGAENLYTAKPDYKFKKIPLIFIPYYAWANRGENEMTVWVHEKN
ncbi:glycoside hydrolase family 127 protein [Muricomes intestini]|jgi:hypothetical protein|uniref:glycoside hydrolase family 127 protein n=1 Tax=Muricomes intestini TaxID=1796634 RepID=UPI0026A87B9C